MSFSNFNRDVTVALKVDLRDLEAAFARAGLLGDATGKSLADSFDQSGRKIGDSFNKGTTKASQGIRQLSKDAEVLGGRGPVSAALDQMATKFDAATSHATKFHNVVADMGKLTLVAGGAGLAGFAGQALKLASDYQTATAKIQGSAGISAKAAQGIGSAFLSTAGKSVFTAQEMADAYGQVAGELGVTQGHALSAAQALSVMRTAGQLAEASQTDLGTATSALSGLLHAYSIGVSRAGAASNVLYNVSRSVNMPLTQVSTALSRLHGRLGELAPSLTDVGGLMVELSHLGMTGQRGIMAVNSSFQTLASQSKKTHQVMQALGLSVYNSQGQFVGLGSIIQQLHPKLAQLTQEQQIYVAQTLFGRQAGEAMLQVMKQGYGAYEQTTQQVQKHGAVTAAATAQEKTLHAQLEILKATVLDLATKFGMFLIPKVEELGKWLSSGIQWLEKHKSAAETLAITIGGVLGTAVATFIAQKMMGFVSWVGNGVKAVGQLAQAVGSAATKMATNFGLIGSSSQTMEAEVTASEREMVATTDASAASIDAALMSTGIGAAVVALGIAAGELATHWSTAWGNIKSITTSIVNSVVGLINQVIGAINKLIGFYNSTIGKLLGSIGQLNQLGNVNFNSASGGYGPGQYNTPGGGTAGGSFGGFKLVPGTGAGGPMTPASFAVAVMRQFGIVPTTQNVRDFTAWEQQEGGNWNNSAKYNPLNTTMGEPGAGNTGSQGNIKVYGSWAQGIAATVATLKSYPSIIAALRAGAPLSQFSATVAGTPWGTGAINASGTGLGNAAIQKLIHQAQSGNPKAAKAIKTLLYTSPLAGDQYTVERTDQGKDYGGIRGNIGAIGAGIITLAQSLQGFGQTIVEKLTQGPNAGRYIYYGLETGATGVGIHRGQIVHPGQTIARGLGTGGVEFGFWNPATGRSEGAPYFTGNNATPPGQAFANWMAQLARGGTYLTTKGGVTTGGGANLGYTIAQLEQAFTNALIKSADALMQRFQNAIQNGTTRTLESVLGVGTSFREIAGYTTKTVGHGRHRHTMHEPVYEPLTDILYHLIETGGGSIQTGFHTVGRGRHRHKVPTYSHLANTFLTTGQEHYASWATGRLEAGGTLSAGQFSALIGTEQSMISHIDNKLVPALMKSANASPQGKAFLQQIAELRANGQGGLANQLLGARWSAMATLAEQAYADQVTKDAEGLNLQATFLKDEAQKEQNYYNAALQVLKAQEQKVVDAMNAVVTAIKDATQLITDQFSSMVQAVQDAAQAMSDSLSAVAQGVTDQTQVKVDILGERGLYGLNLIAQKLQVVVDQTKTYWDQQIALAQKNLDSVTATWHAQVNAAQIAVDQTQIQQDQRVALEQSHLDTVTIIQDQRIEAAQRHADSVQLHEDVSVVGPAQIAVDLNANAPKSVQNIFGALLKRAQGTAGVAEGRVAVQLAGINYSAQGAIQAAQNAFDKIQGDAQKSIANAEQTLASITGQANLAIANAQSALAGVQGAAGVAEAQASSAQAIAAETASTQFAGTGTVVNIYGIPAENAADVAGAVDWVARTQLH